MIFSPWPSLVEGLAHPQCRAAVVIPARNEEESLVATCDALAAQVDDRGCLLDPFSFEVLLLLNNCTDRSAQVARQWKAEHPSMMLHICECALDEEDAHVGTARRMLMDTAWHRMAGNVDDHVCGILSTDADTVPATDWVFENLRALEAGADAVGGFISLHDEDYEKLPETVQIAYDEDALYQALIAELEDRLDSQAGDGWPRHLQHFGASLACTPAAYERAGGMPAIRPLEDVAFVDALRRTDAKLRHEPRVRVTTSARLLGRVEVGLSGQLREWHAMGSDGAERWVQSAEYLGHRFRTLQDLREFFAGAECSVETPETWAERMRDCRQQSGTCGQFLADLDCNRLIDEAFRGEREVPVAQAISALRNMLDETRGLEQRLSLQAAY